MTNKYTQERTTSFTATIASGQTISNMIDLGGNVLCGLSFPATLTGTSISFQVSNDGSTFKDYYNALGQLVSVIFVSNKFIGLVPSDFAGFRFIKVVSQATEDGARSIELFGRGL